MPASPDSILG